MSIIVPKKLKALVHSYLENSDRKIESGGYFFGKTNDFLAFLPIPNYSDKPLSSYSLDNTLSIAEHYMRMIGMDIIADMHTHPDGTIPSGKDMDYIRGKRWKYHVVIADKGDEFEWFVIDRDLHNVQVVESNIELELYGEIFASEVGLTYLGQVFLTEKGEIIGNEDSKRFLILNEDVWRVWTWYKNQRGSLDMSRAKASRDLKLSPARVKKAFEILKI